MAGVINLGALRTTLSVFDDVSPTLLRMGQTFDDTGRHVDSLSVKIAKFGMEIGRATAENVEILNDRMASLGKKALIAAAAIPIVGAGFARTAVQLNSSIANVTSLLGELSEVEMAETVDGMREAIQRLALETGSSTQGVTDGLYEVVSALEFTEDSFTQLELATKSGVAGLSTTQQSFQLLSAVTKAYGDTSAAAFTKVSDLAFQTVKLGQTTYPELAASIGQVAPIANAMSVSMEEMFAITAAVAGQTGSTSMAMTQMASALAGLSSPTDDLKKVFKELGVESGKAAIEQFGFAKTLDMVVAKANKMGVSVKDLLGRKEAWLLTTGLAGDKMVEFGKKMDGMTKAAAAGGSVLQEAFDRQTDGVNKVGFAWIRLTGSIKIASEKIGELLLPLFGFIIAIFQKAMDIFNAFMDVLGKIPNIVRTVIVGFISLAATFGGLLLSFSSMIKLALLLAAALGKLSIHVLVFGGIKTALTLLGAAIGGQIGGWLVWTAGVKTASAAMWGLQKASAAFMGTTAGMTLGVLAAAAAGAKLGSALLEAGDNIQGTNDHTRQAIREVGLLEGAWALLGDALSGFGPLLDRIGQFFEDLLGPVGKVFSAITSYVKFLGKGALSLVSIFGDAINALGNTLYAVDEAQRQATEGLSEWAAEMRKVHEEVQKREADAVAEQARLIKLGKKDVTIEDLVQKSSSEETIKKAQDIVGETMKILDLATAYRVLAIAEAKRAVIAKEQEAAVEAITGLKAKEKAKKLAEEAAEATKKHAAAVRDLADAFRGMPDLDTIAMTLEALGQVDLRNMQPAQIEALAKAFMEWEKAGVAVTAEMEEVIQAWLLADAEAQALALSIETVNLELAEQARIAGLLGPGLEGLKQSFADIGSAVGGEGGIEIIDNVKLMESIRQLDELSKVAEANNVEIEGLGRLSLELLSEAAKRGLDLEGVFERVADEVEEGANQISKMEGAMMGISFLAGAVGGQFGEMLQAVDGIASGFDDWNDKLTTSSDKFNMIAGAVGQIGGVIGGTAGSTLSGAAGGAMTGFAVGGPIGAVVGGVIGGVMGFMKGKKQKEEERQKQIQDSLTLLGDTASQIEDLINEKLAAGVSGLSSMFGRLAMDTNLTQERLDNMGIIGVAMFQTLRDEGYSVVEAMMAIGDSLDQALATAEEQGLALTGVFGQLAQFRNLVMDNQELVAGVEGMSAVFEALRATGNLTQETFNALRNEMIMGYDDMIEAGFTADQALALMAPTLLQIRNAARDGQIAIDAETQALIDQAETAGLFEGLEDPMEKLVELQELMLLTVSALVDVFGGQLPAAVQTYIDSINRIPPVPTPPGGVPGGAPDGAAPPNPPSIPRDEYNPDFEAQSGFFSGSMPVGPRPGGGTDLRVHPGERVSVMPEGAGAAPIVNLHINENPMQTAETTQRMREFTVETVDRKLATHLAELVAAGEA
jgi:TP901 family phage tail tape measure protein